MTTPGSHICKRATNRRTPPQKGLQPLSDSESSSPASNLAARFAQGPAELHIDAACKIAVEAGYDKRVLEVVAAVGKFEGAVPTNNVLALLVANATPDFNSTVAALKAALLDAEAFRAAVKFVASLDSAVSSDDVAVAISPTSQPSPVAATVLDQLVAVLPAFSARI